MSFQGPIQPPPSGGSMSGAGDSCTIAGSEPQRNGRLGPPSGCDTCCEDQQPSGEGVDIPCRDIVSRDRTLVETDVAAPALLEIEGESPLGIEFTLFIESLAGRRIDRARMMYEVHSSVDYHLEDDYGKADIDSATILPELEWNRKGLAALRAYAKDPGKIGIFAQLSWTGGGTARFNVGAGLRAIGSPLKSSSG